MFKPLNHRINQWHGRRVWVVGASSGIGAALAQALLQAGARVVLSARSASGLAQVAAGHPLAEVLPLDVTDDGKVTEFLLVPYFGACIHSPPPPSNQIIHVRPREAAKGVKSMDAVWISGTLKTLRSDTFMGASSYRLEAVAIEIYTEKK